MNISDENRLLWLWLRRNAGHRPSEAIAEEVGLPPLAVFRALHAMQRRGLIEQLPPQERGGRMQYGVSDACLVPLGLTVGEASSGTPRTSPAAARESKPSRPRQAGTGRAWKSMAGFGQLRANP